MTEPFDSQNIGDNHVFNPKQSMYIEASAGTGKTYTIQQIAARLIYDGYPLSRILIVTYTEKAAGELKVRIREKLAEVIETRQLVKGRDNPIEDDRLERFRDELRNLDNAQIYTIHSFCQKTLRENAYDAQRPFDMNLVDDKAIKYMIEGWVRDKWPNNPVFERLISNIQDNISVDKITKKLVKKLTNAVLLYILDKNGQETSIHLKQTLTLCGEETELLTIQEIKSYNNLLKLPKFKKNLDIIAKYRSWHVSSAKTSKTIDDFIKTMEQWSIKYALFNGRSFNRDRIIKANGASEDCECIKAFDYFKELKEQLPDLAKLNIDELDFLHAQLPEIYKAWKKYKLDNKLESYNDMIQAVHESILNPQSALRSHIRKAYQFAIIDEFQDTNQLQWDIFKTVFLNSSHHTDEEPHAIYAVGDPKQSIYAFQGADLTVYHEAIKAIGVGNHLDTNYRSTKAMIESCNRLFSEDFFPETDGISFTESKAPAESSSQYKAHPTWNGGDIPPIWTTMEKCSKYDYAKKAAQAIAECCSIDPASGRTRLQIFRKRSKTDTPDTLEPLRDVQFSDFAILARTKSEFSPIEKELTALGIPFLRYKDDKLFDGRECAEWISLFSAVNAPDFSASHRHFLTKALLTDFFDAKNISNIETDDVNNSKLYYADNPYYDSPLCEERIWIAEWKKLALQGRWAEMQERIYQNTQIETRLSNDLSKLQELSKLRQIGNYCIDYLYTNKCTIDDLILHLRLLQNSSDNIDDKDGNLVARGTDFKAVQLMTIHASKGLEFPIVISAAGFIGYNDKAVPPFVYHAADQNGQAASQRYLGFSKEAKAKRQTEDETEWHRLFYVAFTRASSILILPHYNECKIKFLDTSMERYCSSNDFFDLDSLPTRTADVLKSTVSDILSRTLGNDGRIDTTSVPEECDDSEDKQIHAIAALQRQIPTLSLIQHSYSSLSKKINKIPIDDFQADSDADMHEEMDVQDDDRPDFIHDPEIDLSPVQVLVSRTDAPDKNCLKNSQICPDFPRGTQIGEVMHAIFEHCDFAAVGNQPSAQDACKLEELQTIVSSSFTKYGVISRADKDNSQNTNAASGYHSSSLSASSFASSSAASDAFMHDDWKKYAVQMVWNTLNARLPVIHGNANAPILAENSQEADSSICVETSDTFALNDLLKEDHHAEVEFLLKMPHPQDDHRPHAENFSKGFIDLLFVRKDEHENEWFSILDWKTDTLPEEDYANPKKLKRKVDMEYAVQRVLYSYALIQWLCTFESYGSDPETVFRNHFGGIYYLFVRGCRAESPCSVYAQTWRSYDELKNSCESILKLMVKSKSEK